MKEIGMSRMQKGLCLVVMSVGLIVCADDLPWKFEGDTHRDAAACDASQGIGLSTLLWHSGCAVQQDTLDSFSSSLGASDGTSLTSMKIGFLLFLH